MLKMKVRRKEVKVKSSYFVWFWGGLRSKLFLFYLSILSVIDKIHIFDFFSPDLE